MHDLRKGRPSAGLSFVCQAILIAILGVVTVFRAPDRGMQARKRGNLHNKI